MMSKYLKSAWTLLFPSGSFWLCCYKQHLLHLNASYCFPFFPITNHFCLNRLSQDLSVSTFAPFLSVCNTAKFNLSKIQVRLCYSSKLPIPLEDRSPYNNADYTQCFHFLHFSLLLLYIISHKGLLMFFP